MKCSRHKLYRTIIADQFNHFFLTKNIKYKYVIRLSLFSSRFLVIIHLNIKKIISKLTIFYKKKMV